MISTILMLLLNANVPNPNHTAMLIKQVAKSAQIDPVLLTKVVILESRGRPDAINEATGDYGIAQINLKSHPQISAACALDARCGLTAGAKILKKAKRPCAYNLGAAKLTENRMKICLSYERKLASIN